MGKPSIAGSQVYVQTDDYLRKTGFNENNKSNILFIIDKFEPRGLAVYYCRCFNQQGQCRLKI